MVADDIVTEQEAHELLELAKKGLAKVQILLGLLY